MWARVDDRAHSHPKFLALDPAAIGLWTMGLSYCGDQLTDGFIPRAQVAKLVSAPAGRTLKLAADLVKHGLWEARGADGFQVHDYLDWNPSAAEVRKERALHRERQARYRNRRTGRFGDASHDPSPDAAVTPAVTSTPTRPDLNPPIIPPASSSSLTHPNGDPDSSWRPGWMPPPGSIYHDGCAKPEFAHLFPPERRAQCPRHQEATK